MHTILHRTPEGGLGRALLLVWSAGELARALLVHGSLKILTWQERSRERSRLASLDDYMLRDMGLSRGDIARETSKPFWQA